MVEQQTNSNHNNTRARLIAEAVRLFAEKGFASTRTSEIEEAAGLAPGSGGAFRYFRSKRRILAEGVADTVVKPEPLVRAMADGLEGIGRVLREDGRTRDVAAAFRSLAERLLTEIDPHSAAAIVVFREAGVSRHEVPELADLAHWMAIGHYDEIASVYRQFLQDNGFDVDGIDIVGQVYVMLAPLYMARIVTWMLGEPPGGFDEDRLLDRWATAEAFKLTGLRDRQRRR
jgi:AcrR family transcriptional regulator